MYRVLIVDDERFMRDGIKRILPWKDLNVSDVETADSGNKALECMKQQMPDLVLTDIEMKNMNGIELIRRMNTINPELRIIVLTGHDDFSYVQECCRMQVQDYLLKPVEPEELAEKIRKQLQELEEEREKKKKVTKEAHYSVLSEQILVNSVFERFLEKKDNLEDIYQLMHRYHWLEGEKIQLAAIAEEDSGNEDWNGYYGFLELSAGSACSEMIEYGGHGVIFRDRSNLMFLLLFCGEKHPETSELIRDIQSVLMNEYDLQPQVYLGEKVDTIQEIIPYYKEALLFFGRQASYSGENAGTQTWILSASQMYSRMMRMTQEAQKNIENQKLVKSLYSDFCLLFAGSDIELKTKKSRWIHFLTDIYMAWLDAGHEASEMDLAELIAVSRKLTGYELYEEGLKFLQKLFGQEQDSSGDVVGNAKNYINGHLSEELSVASLADRYYLSVAYFSKLFKKKEGIGCNYYIVHQRMERAKQLLRNKQLKVQEVAVQVGYQDVNYFSNAFKKYTGVSPADYRNK